MPIQVLMGNEPYIIDKKVSNIKKRVNFPEMNLSIYDEINEEVASMVQTLPMAEDNRVVIITLDEIKGDDIISLIEDNPSSTDLVIIVKNIDKRTAFYKFVKKNKMLIECNKLTDMQLRRFVFDILKEKSCKITNSAYSLLVKRINYFEDPEVSLYTVEVFIRQLMYLSSIITDYEVTKVVPESSNEKVYMLTKAILNGNQEKTFSLALDFIDRNENIIGILSMMLRVFRLAFKAALYKDYNKAELGSLLGVPLYQFQDALTVPVSSINLILDTIQAAINGIKTGHCEASEMFLISIGKIISILKPSDVDSSKGSYVYL